MLMSLGIIACASRPCSLQRRGFGDGANFWCRQISTGDDEVRFWRVPKTARWKRAVSRELPLRVNISARVRELGGLLFQPFLDCRFLIDPLLRCKFPNVFGDAHAAEMRSAHRAEMRGLCTFCGKCSVVELACGFRIKRKIELIFPAKFKTRFTDGIV